MRVLNIVLNGVLNDGRVMKTARSAVSRGSAVRILGFSKTREPEKHQIEQIEIILTQNARWKIQAAGLWERDPEKRDMEKFVSVAAEIFLEHALEFRPDLIHTHDMFGLGTGAYLIRRMAENGQNPAWVHDAHEYTRGSTNIAENLRLQAINQHTRFIREPDALLTVSPIIADYLVEEDNLAVRPSVVLNAPQLNEDGAESSNDIRSALGLSSEIPLIVYSGSIASKFRGVDTLIEALPLMPDIHVALVTDRPDSFKLLMNRAIELGCSDRLHEHPYVPIGQITSFLRTASIGCHPMLHYGNGEVALPNKLFEYIHARIPILVSDVNAMRAFVSENGLGEVFEANNPKALAAAVQSMLPLLGDYAARMSDDFVESFSWERQEKELFMIYDRITAAYELRKGDLRIMHGVTSAAGQPFATANALRHLGLRADSVRLFAEKTRAQYRSHFVCDFKGNSNRLALFARLSSRYDVFHFYARSFFDVRPGYAAPSLQDLYAIKATGKSIIYNLRGSEARIPSIFREKCPHHWLPENPPEDEIENEQSQRLFLDVIESVVDKIVVTDPELLTYVPQAQVIPRAIDLTAWPAVALPKAPSIKVLHAPTNRVFKGTDVIINAVDALRREGLNIDFVLAEQMPQNELRQAIHTADIVIDQIRIGWYGVLAIESMASGRPVVAYIRDDLIDELPDDLPLANANAYTLIETLRELVTSLEKRETLAARGRAYVETVHDATHIATQYAALYDNVSKNSKDVELAPYARLMRHQLSPPVKAQTKPARVQVKSVKEQVQVRSAKDPVQVKPVQSHVKPEPNLAKFKQIPIKMTRLARHNYLILRVLKRPMLFQRIKNFRNKWRKLGGRKTLRIYRSKLLE